MEQMNSILSWSNPAPIIVRKDKQQQLRTFCPIVLFHEHTYKNDHSIEKCVKIHTGDEHHGEFIRSWKKRVDAMLQMNSRDWKIIGENSKYEERLICREDHMPQSAIQLSNTIYSHTSLIPQDQMETMKPKRRRGNLPKAVTALLKDWLAKHKKHPYPTEEEKLLLSKETKLSLQQISNWFINARRRHLPHLLENEHSMNNSLPAPELDIYPYEAADSAEDADNRLRCSSRVSNKTGGVKKPKPYGLQHKRKTVTAL